MKRRVWKYIEKLNPLKDSHSDILYEIGNYKIWLPFKHRLPEFQKKFKNYDKKLKFIVQSIEKYDNRNIIIDIGANVGDTAALLRSNSGAKIFCIEGDNHYLNYLKRNSKIIPEITIIDTFLSDKNHIVKGNIKRNTSSAKIETCIDGSLDQIIKLKTLSQILGENYIKVEDIQLIKIDTEGYDFKIILSNKNIIETNRPNLFFEYDISFNEEDMEISLEVINFLESTGYNIIVYDNFGNLLDYFNNNIIHSFIKINKFLWSCNSYGGGINYLDIFATQNTLIFEDVVKMDNNQKLKINI